MVDTQTGASVAPVDEELQPLEQIGPNDWRTSAKTPFPLLVLNLLYIVRPEQAEADTQALKTAALRSNLHGGTYVTGVRGGLLFGTGDEEGGFLPRVKAAVPVKREGAAMQCLYIVTDEASGSVTVHHALTGEALVSLRAGSAEAAVMQQVADLYALTVLPRMEADREGGA